MDKDVIKLLQQRLAERTREPRTTREAAPENKFRKLPAQMSSKNEKLVYKLSSKEPMEEQTQVLRHEASFSTADAKPANMTAAVEAILSQTGATDETKSLYASGGLTFGTSIFLIIFCIWFQKQIDRVNAGFSQLEFLTDDDDTAWE
ncbi:hypothetical protein SprV_0902688600 [Sparganum proliferum]